MIVINIKNVKKFWNGSYNLVADFETSDGVFTAPFCLSPIDSAPAAAIIKEMIDNGEYEGSIEFVPEPAPEEINTLRERIQAEIKTNGNP